MVSFDVTLSSEAAKSLFHRDRDASLSMTYKKESRYKRLSKFRKLETIIPKKRRRNNRLQRGLYIGRNFTPIRRDVKAWERFGET